MKYISYTFVKNILHINGKSTKEYEKKDDLLLVDLDENRGTY